MLREIPIKKVRQIKGEPKRRWFVDDDFDLIVWQGNWKKLVGFQLCYTRENEQKALTWMEDKGFFHNTVDEGEDKPGKPKGVPILLPDGIFDFKVVAEEFRKQSADIKKSVSEFVYDKLVNYPELISETSKIKSENMPE